MNELTFAEPNWLWGGLLLLPLLLLRLFSHLRTARQLPGLVSPRLAHRLVNGAGQARRWAVFALQSLALACLLAALARPQMGYEEIESEFDARNLLLAIDTSRSMMADDLAPNRLSRAKLAAKDIALSLPDDRIGLVAFAGKPFLQAPLTVDHEAVLDAIDQLDTETIPRGGTNLSAAVALAIETVEEAKLGPSALVLFSDGEALEGLGEIEKIRERAAGAGLSLLAVGVGTAEGAIIPETDDAGQILPGVFVKDENGQVVRTRLTTEALRALAADGGTYLHLGGAASLTQVVDQIRRGIASSREDGETTRRPIERFLWPLSAAAILLVLSHVLPLLWLKPAATRRTSSSRNLHRAVSLFLCLVAASVSAQEPQDDKQALAEMERQIAEIERQKTELERKRAKLKLRIEDYERRLAEARLPGTKNRLRMGVGAAAYQSENYDQALKAYGEALASGNDRLRRDAHYNIGNTLYRRGKTILEGAAANPDQIQSPTASREARDLTIRDWESAIEHFESSLALAPDNLHAKYNRDYVREHIEELKQQKEKEEEQQKQEEQKKDEENKDEEEKEKQDPSDQDQNQNQDGSEDSKEKSEDQKSEGQPDKSDESDGSDGSNEPDNPPPGETQPQEEPEAPQDGALESTPPQSQQDQSPPNPTNAAEAQANPLTGYSPTEARQLLEALADETEVKPLVPLPARGEKFKNW